MKVRPVSAPHAASTREAVVEGLPELVIDDAVREAVAEALAALLLVEAEREGLIVLADASQ